MMRHINIFFGLAVLTTLTTLPLLFIGGSVTSLDAGMAYPDAPLSNGALVNPAGWTEQIDTRTEHGHRLAGWIVGMLCVAMVIASFATERRRWVRMTAIACLFAVVVQGLLGIFRVKLTSLGLATVHGIWAQVTFSLLACLSLFSSPWWRDTLAMVELPRAGSIRRSSLWVVAMLVVQLVFGAMTRHDGSWAALIAHIWWGTMTAVALGRLGLMILGDVLEQRWIRRAAGILIGLTAAQLTLGLAAFVVTGGSSARVSAPTFMQWLVPTAHVVTGALLLACASVVSAICHRALQPLPGRANAASIPASALSQTP